jgi:hypothetical protein
MDEQKELGIWLAAKINRVKMGDITANGDISVSLKKNYIYISHEKAAVATKFTNRLKLIVKAGGNKMNRIIT